MADRTIASRPSLEQVSAIVEFMEKHPQLAMGQLRGLEGRDQSKKLWYQLTRIVNNISGPTRPMKSWVKYWADKKSTVRTKVQCGGGDPVTLSSNIEKKIWDLFLANDPPKTRTSVKQESEFMDESFFEEESMDQNHVQSEPVLIFETANVDVEERQLQLMERLVKVMGDQATALSRMANASNSKSQALERLAEASHVQAQAVDRLATTFESISAATHDVRHAIMEIDANMKRFYNTSTT